ncbi:MAG: flavin reductase family protein [Anaerolineae bacterium]|nr:flavin reductase family protein [Anaerolineae bacterium]
MEFTPGDLDRKDFYKLLTGTVVPRPIAWVSTVDTQGRPNLAPFSFFNVVCAKPPTVLFCPGVRSTDGSIKDTLKNVAASREFVINIVTEDLAEAMNLTATELPAEVNEFEFAKLTPAPSKTIAAPRVKESPVHIECKLVQIIEIGGGAVGSGSIVIGEVSHMHISDEVMLPDHKIDTLALKPLGRLAGPNYSIVREILEIQRLPTQIKPK